MPCHPTESKCWFLMVSKHLAKHLVFGGLGKKWLQSANMVNLECWNGTGAKHTVYSVPPPCSLQTMDIVGPTLKQKHMFQTQHWQTEWTQESKPSWLTLPWFWCVSHSTSFACCFANQLDLTDFPPGCHDWAVLRRGKRGKKMSGNMGNMGDMGMVFHRFSKNWPLLVPVWSADATKMATCQNHPEPHIDPYW